jgi:hypothetical protein
MARAFLTLSLLDDEFAVCRLHPESNTPAWVSAGKFSSITRTPDELSIVCAARHVPQDVKCERGWRALKLEGPLDFALTGIVASVAKPLAEAEIAIFPMATYDTKYMLIKADQVGPAINALTTYGHVVHL